MPSESIGIRSAEIDPGRVEAVATLRASAEGEYAGIVRQVALAIHDRGRRTRREVDDLAAGAVNEAVRRVLEDPGSFDPARSAFAWIVAVAVRVSREWGRAPRRRLHQVGLGLEAWGTIQGRDGPGDESRVLDRSDLDWALALLDPPDRHALVCHYSEGLTDGALAEALGTATASAARSRVFRAKKKARDLVNRRRRGEVDS